MARQRASFSSDNKNVQRSKEGIKDRIDNNLNKTDSSPSARTKARADSREAKRSLLKSVKSNSKQSKGFT